MIKILEWHENLMRRLSENSLRMAIVAKLLIIFSVGSMLSIQLADYGLWVLIGAVLFSLLYFNINFFSWFENQTTKYSTQVLGFLAAGLLIFFFGIQTQQLPYKVVFLGVGVALLIWPSIELFANIR
ncbi:hypothetical protein GOV04_04335 [Candidatus Woesearchaeota archaeon]|nr:hypothetical protein [Candidatus Woesearchaeota archaeon]